MRSTRLNKQVAIGRSILSTARYVFPRCIYVCGALSFFFAAKASAVDAPLVVVSRDAHERQWRQTNEVGDALTQFTEIATGLCYWDAAAQTWRDSNPEIEI